MDILPATITNRINLIAFISQKWREDLKTKQCSNSTVLELVNSSFAKTSKIGKNKKILKIKISIN